MVGVCQTCGDIGFSNALIYCEKCDDACQHRYCADKLSFTEDVIWFCEDCLPRSAKQNSVAKPTCVLKHKSKGIMRKRKRRVKNLKHVTQIVNQLTGDWLLNEKNNHELHNGKGKAEIQKDCIAHRLVQENPCTRDEFDQNLVLPDDPQKNQCTRDESVQTKVLPDDPQGNLFLGDESIKTKFLPDDLQENLYTCDESVQIKILPDDPQENRFSGDESFKKKFFRDELQENLCTGDESVRTKILRDDLQENLFSGDESVKTKFLPDDLQENLCTGDESIQTKILPDDPQENLFSGEESVKTEFLPDDLQENLCTGDESVQTKILPDDPHENLCTVDESSQTKKLPDDLRENLSTCDESVQTKNLPDDLQENLCTGDESIQTKILPDDLQEDLFIGDEPIQTRILLDDDPQENLCTGEGPVRTAVLPNDPHDNLDQYPIVFTQPIIDQVWRGQFHICNTTATNKNFGVVEGLAAHLSNKASWRVFKEASLLPTLLCLKMFPKSQVWCKESEPSDNDIGLFFFSGNKVHEKAYDCLVDGMLSEDLAMKAVVKNAELLVFTSSELPLGYWRFQRKLYLWGVFKDKEKSSNKDYPQ